MALLSRAKSLSLTLISDDTANGMSLALILGIVGPALLLFLLVLSTCMLMVYRQCIKRWRYQHRKRYCYVPLHIHEHILKYFYFMDYRKPVDVQHEGGY